MTLALARSYDLRPRPTRAIPCLIQTIHQSLLSSPTGQIFFVFGLKHALTLTMRNALQHWFERIKSTWHSNKDQFEEADALILECNPTGEVDKDLIQMRLLLQVTPSHGRNFISEFHKYFQKNELDSLSSGKKLKIHYQPNHPTKIEW